MDRMDRIIYPPSSLIRLIRYVWPVQVDRRCLLCIRVNQWFQTLLLMLLTGCAATPEPRAEPLPRLDEIAPGSVPGPGPGTSTTPVAPVSASAIKIVRLDFPLEQRFEEAWAFVSAGAPREWQANAMRAGVLRADQAAKFFDALPGAQASAARVERSRADWPIPLGVSPRVRRAATLRLSLDGREEQRLVDRGEFRLLVRRWEVPGGGLLELTPQHAFEQVTLNPRSAQEKLLDGEVYEPLAWRVALGPGEHLVVGLLTPPAPPTPLDTLGAAMFTGVRHQQPVQVLLLISQAP